MPSPIIPHAPVRIVDALLFIRHATNYFSPSSAAASRLDHGLFVPVAAAGLISAGVLSISFCILLVSGTPCGAVAFGGGRAGPGGRGPGARGGAGAGGAAPR